MRPSVLVLLAALGLLSLARGQDAKPQAPEPAKAPTPGHGVILLKEAWDAGDLDAIVLRYAEPGASFVRSDLAALRRVEDAQADLARAVTEKVGAAAAEELVPQEKRVASPLVNASVTMLASRVKSESTATTKFRVATRDGERFFRFTHVLVGDDWKIVLSSLDGVPLDDKALRRVATATDAHRKAADAMTRLAREVRAGTLTGRDAIKKKIVQLLADEKSVVEEDERGEKGLELHEND